MIVSEITAFDLAVYARYAITLSDYNALANKGEIELALEAAKGYVRNYTNVDLDSSLDSELAVAVLVVGAEMLDNRQMTAQYSTQNPLVKQILDMHSSNLLPEVML